MGEITRCVILVKLFSEFQQEAGNVKISRTGSVIGSIFTEKGLSSNLSKSVRCEPRVSTVVHTLSTYKLKNNYKAGRVCWVHVHSADPAFCC